jgi:hypothetical protein
MVLKYDIEIQNSSVINSLKKVTNQIYKLLPMREERLDWSSLLTTLMEELRGMDSLLIDQHDLFFPLLCKLEGLYSLKTAEDFFSYRRTIFECLNIIDEIKQNVTNR